MKLQQVLSRPDLVASAPYDVFMGNVPNPLYEYLRELQSVVRDKQDQLKGKLDRPLANFATGNVWSGPTAERWGDRLHEQRGIYNAQLQMLEAVVSDRLASTPPTCDEAEALSWKRRLNNG